MAERGAVGSTVSTWMIVDVMGNDEHDACAGTERIGLEVSMTSMADNPGYLHGGALILPYCHTFAESIANVVVVDSDPHRCAYDSV